MTKLFIIGNGFDSAHGLKSSYNHFREYLLSNYAEINMDTFIAPEEIHDQDGGVSYDQVQVLSMLFYLINEAENNAEEWNEIETSLGKLDFSQAFDWYDDILDEDGDIDLFKTVYRNEDISSQLVIPTTTIQEFFFEWINTIDLNSVTSKEDFQKFVNEQDLFLNFNYTETLEEVYGIQEENVCHIHGKQNEVIFFGHGSQEDYTDSYMQNHIGSQDSLKQIDEQLRKKVEIALENNLDFFNSIEETDINEIYSYGFSFSEVDWIYLREICNRIKTKNIIWYFNDYDVKKLFEFKEVLWKCNYKGSFDTFHC